ncbi:hypothetical protein L226DRAFT_291929 [Lentinus tigrinus ALCF2SS1-7]|uniref:uncharacterized protein n=1 Tax=Lentinus tigrinus ALCF2SS1-7 TaxID=1328758 RepID=UPI001165EEAA|nr:hypothetical protein L226DRAFT_291929 [Lentinus tigrinus ALCF2SS1-7]
MPHYILVCSLHRPDLASRETLLKLSDGYTLRYFSIHPVLASSSAQRILMRLDGIVGIARLADAPIGLMVPTQSPFGRHVRGRPQDMPDGLVR